MKTFSILASTSSRSSRWQLAGFLGTSTSVLLGWRQTPRAVDAGVPDEVAGIISRALCRCTRVSFLYSEIEDITATHSMNYSIQPILAPGFIASLIARCSGIGTSIPVTVVSSNDPKVVILLFNVAYFSWDMQGQSVFLSSLSDPAPDLGDVLSKTWQKKYDVSPVSYNAWTYPMTVLPKTWQTKSDADPMRIFTDYPLAGVMRPGVDGDVAGILFRSIADKENFITVLQEEAELSGMQFKMCDEVEFMDSLSYETKDVSHHHEQPGM